MKLLNSFFDYRGITYIEVPRATAAGENDVTLDVPCYRQSHDYSCGFVAGLMVRHTFYPHKSAEAFWNRLMPDEETGVTTKRLARALRGSGIGLRTRHALRFLEIKKVIDDGYPIISTVRVKAEIEHWILIFGYGVRPNRLFIAGEGFPYLSYLLASDVLWAKFMRRLGIDREFLICWGAK